MADMSHTVLEYNKCLVLCRASKTLVDEVIYHQSMLRVMAPPNMGKERAVSTPI